MKNTRCSKLDCQLPHSLSRPGGPAVIPHSFHLCPSLTSLLLSVTLDVSLVRWNLRTYSMLPLQPCISTVRPKARDLRNPLEGLIENHNPNIRDSFSWCFQLLLLLDFSLKTRLGQCSAGWACSSLKEPIVCISSLL